jgi:hypothetical protein
MTRPDHFPDRLDETDPLQDVVRYAPGLLAIALTVGVSLVDHLPVGRPPLTDMLLVAGVPAALLAVLVSRSDWDPSGSRFLVLTVLAWGVFSLARIPLLDPQSTLVDGSLYVLADLGTVWLGSYATAAAVVYGIDWPTPHVARDGDVSTRDADPADD